MSKIEAGAYNTHRFWRFIDEDNDIIVHIKTIDGFPSKIEVWEDEGEGRDRKRKKAILNQAAVDALLRMLMGAQKDGHMEFPNKSHDDIPEVDWQSCDTDGENWEGIPDQENK